MAEDQKNMHSIDNRHSDEASSSTNDGAGERITAGAGCQGRRCKALNEKYLRLAAEFDNYKRLAQRDQAEQIKFGNEQILKELLPVVDNLERAIKSAKGTGTVDALTEAWN